MDVNGGEIDRIFDVGEVVRICDELKTHVTVHYWTRKAKRFKIDEITEIRMVQAASKAYKGKK